MPQLNRDILREVFYEIANTDAFGNNMDKFMMAGKEPFNLVLDICKKSNSVVVFDHYVFARLPNVHNEMAMDEYDSDMDPDDYALGTAIPTKMKFFKPISIAVASSLTSLDIRCCYPEFSPELIPMLKSLNREMDEVIIRDYNYQLENILESCDNIPNVRNGVTISFCQGVNDAVGMKSFAIPCRKLTMKKADLGRMYEEMKKFSFQLRNIRDLTIKGTFHMTDAFDQQLYDFANFLKYVVPKVETLNVKFELKNVVVRNFWNWNSVEEMANLFKGLQPRIKSCICFKIINARLDEIDETEYPGVQRSNDEYYKIVPITDTLTFKMSYWYNAQQR